MGIPDYNFRDQTAVSQITQGFMLDAFMKKLRDTQVTVAFDGRTSSSRDGCALLDMLVRLAARFYPNLRFSTDDEENHLVTELVALARRINPNVDIGGEAPSRVNLVIGEQAPTPDAGTTIFVGCDGWTGRVGTKGSYTTSDLGNPFGAGFAACLAVANVFRSFFLPENERDIDAAFPTDEEPPFPNLTPVTLDEPLVLAGVGAIGNSVAWALSHTPLVGNIHLVDNERIELSNLQRYVLCERSDEGKAKAETIAGEFSGTLKAVPYVGTWQSFLSVHGYKWERVLVALDSIRDRRKIQGSLPHWIANGWTQIGDLGVSTHSFLGEGACLACLYLPLEASKNEDEIVSEELRIPQYRDQIRRLLGTGQGADEWICDAIADAYRVRREELASYIGRPIRQLREEMICGGGIIRLGAVGAFQGDLQVPLAFQSAFAGVLLAAEAARDVLTSGADRRSSVRQLDITRPMGDWSPRHIPKRGTGRCICEDRDFIDTYQTKYLRRTG